MGKFECVYISVIDNQRYESRKIEIDDDSSYIKISVGETDKVDPIKFYEDYFKKSRFILYREAILNELKATSTYISMEDIEAVAIKHSDKDWQKNRKETLAIPIPDEIKKLLKSKRKKEQIQLLKNFKVTSAELMAYTFYAFQYEGYLLTQIVGEHDPIGTDTSQKPRMIHVEGEKVTSVGKTNLTKGQLKHIVNHQIKTVARILEKDDEWHCFFITYGSLRGDESWKDGQPHFHYISDKFGISKEVLIEQLRSREYKLGNLPHIDLIGMKETKK